MSFKGNCYVLKYILLILHLPDSLQFSPLIVRSDILNLGSMFNRSGSIVLIALGSVIVIIGVILYAQEVFGAVGMIAIGALVEAIGAYYYIKNNKK